MAETFVNHPKFLIPKPLKSVAQKPDNWRLGKRKKNQSQTEEDNFHEDEESPSIATFINDN